MLFRSRTSLRDRRASPRWRRTRPEDDEEDEDVSDFVRLCPRQLVSFIRGGKVKEREEEWETQIKKKKGGKGK